MKDNTDIMHAQSRSTYLSCGAEWLPGRRTGKQRWVESTTASCCLSSHTNEHHNGGWKRSDGWVLAFHTHCFYTQDHSFIHSSFFWCLLPPSLHPSSLPLSVFIFFLCVCVLRSGQAVWTLIWNSSGFGQCLPSWLLDWRTGSVTDSPTDWITTWLTNWTKGWLTFRLIDWAVIASHEPEPNRC